MDPSRLGRQSGVVVGLAGAGLVAVGLWGRREVRRTLARERITSTADAKPPNAPVRSGAAARTLAEVIRARTVAASGGRVYAEVEEFLDADGHGTSDATTALKDDRTGQPLENPEHALWIQSTTLQTALLPGVRVRTDRRPGDRPRRRAAGRRRGHLGRRRSRLDAASHAYG